MNKLNDVTVNLRTSDAINHRIEEILDAGLMPLGNCAGTIAALDAILKHTDMESDKYLDKDFAIDLVQEIYLDERYRTPISLKDIEKMAKVVCMIPLDASDEENSTELVASLVVDAYVKGRERIEKIYRLFPDELRENDWGELAESIEEFLDWVDVEINIEGNTVPPTFDAAKRAIEEQVKADREYPTYIQEEEVNTLAAVIHRVPIVPEMLSTVCAQAVSDYFNLLQDMEQFGF